MIKNNAQLLNTLINEIEGTIINNEVSELASIGKAAKMAISDLDYTDLLNGKHLPLDLKNELGFLIQTYGNELLYFINQHCPPMSFSMAISAFIFEKEKHKVKKLQKILNRYIDIEDIIVYRLDDYLTLGYPFFDSLFYVYFYRYKIDKFNVWGLVSISEYEKPKYSPIEKIDKTVTTTKVKNNPKGKY